MFSGDLKERNMKNEMKKLAIFPEIEFLWQT